jgi:hypothetical protein
MKKTMALLFVLLILVYFPITATAHEPNLGPFPLAGQYSVVVTTEHLNGDSWVFTYTITNLTEKSDYTGIPDGMPTWCNGIDPTGLDGFFVKIPRGATISNIHVPQPFRFEPPGGYWIFAGPQIADDAYDWINIWGNGPQSIYPIGKPLTFSIQLDNVQVGANEARITTFFYDHAIRYPGNPNNSWFSVYTTQIISPIPSPKLQIDNIHKLFDTSVLSGNLAGDGPGSSANGRLKALRNMLERAEELIDNGYIAEARQQLEDAYKKTDGDLKPPDFVKGSATKTLAAAIQNLIYSLGNR